MVGDRSVLTEGSAAPVIWTRGEVGGYLHEVRFRIYLGDLTLDPFAAAHGSRPVKSFQEARSDLADK